MLEDCSIKTANNFQLQTGIIEKRHESYRGQTDSNIGEEKESCSRYNTNGSAVSIYYMILIFYYILLYLI